MQVEAGRQVKLLGVGAQTHRVTVSHLTFHVSSHLCSCFLQNLSLMSELKVMHIISTACGGVHVVYGAFYSVLVVSGGAPLWVLQVKTRLLLFLQILSDSEWRQQEVLQLRV